MVYIDILVLILAGVIIAESEKIYRCIYKLGGHTSVWFPGWKWYISNNWKYDNKIIDLIMRYFAAPFKDGFHFIKTVGIVLFSLVASGYDILLAIAFLLAYSIGFNLRYHIENGKWS